MKRTAALLFCLANMILASPSADDIAAWKQKLALASGAERQAIAGELALALTLRGEAEQERHDHKAARLTFNEALGVLAARDAVPSARLLKGAGLSELILGDYEKALDHLLGSLTAAERNHERPIITASTYLIGYVHRDLGNFDLSLDYFEAAHESALAGNDKYYAVMALNEIGNVLVYRERYAEALPYKERSLQLAREFADRKILATCLHDMGHLFLMQDRAEKAIPYFRESLAIQREVGGEREIMIILVNTADAYRRLGRPQAGLACLDEARSMAEKSGQAKNLSDIIETYSRIHESMNNYAQALVFQRRFQELREQVFNEEKAKQTTELQTRYEVEKKQRENELLRREKEIAALAASKQRSQRNFLFFVALLVLLLAAVLYYNFRAKASANRWLEEANLRISAQQGKLEKAYRQMEDLARYDQLTGLPNRRAALEEIEREEKRFQRSQNPFTLVMADLDGFKAVNDRLGHDAGDFVLKAAAALISGALRAQDMVARWGGDEFLFLLPGTDAQGARVLCQAVGEKVGGHDFEFNGRHLKLAVSLGAGTFRPGITIGECLREADQAMYRSRDGAASPPADAPGR